MKRCGHMFREKLPFSDLWTELRKVATLKRKVWSCRSDQSSKHSDSAVSM